MSPEGAEEHLSNFWGQYNPHTSPFIARRRLGNASPYCCDNCGSFDVESRDCDYAHLEAANARPLLDGQLGTRDPQEIASYFVESLEAELQSLTEQDMLESDRQKMAADISTEIERIEASVQKDGATFRRIGSAWDCFFEFRRDRENFLGTDAPRDNHLLFPYFTDPKNFPREFRKFLQIRNKSRFLKCLFFDVLIDQALYTRGVQPQHYGACLYGRVKVGGILAASGTMVNPFLVLLAATGWAHKGESEKEFEELCWLYERELRRARMGYLYAASKAEYHSHVPETRDLKREILVAAPWPESVEDLRETAYFYSCRSSLNSGLFNNWVAIIKSVFAY